MAKKEQIMLKEMAVVKCLEKNDVMTAEEEVAEIVEVVVAEVDTEVGIVEVGIAEVEVGMMIVEVGIAEVEVDMMTVEMTEEVDTRTVEKGITKMQNVGWSSFF